MKDKILFITAFVPHKAAAGEKNTMIMLNDLASKYDVDLIYFKYDNDIEYKPEKENVYPIKVVRNSTLVKIKGILCYPLIHPFFSVRFSWTLCKEINKLVVEKKYKAVVLNHSFVFLYGKYMDMTIPKILFAHDVIAQRITRSSSWLMQKFCIASERKGFNLPNAHVFSFSQKDCDLIKNLYGKDAHLCLDYIDEQIVEKQPQRVEEYYTLFGDWTRKDNSDGVLWLIDKVLPLINKDVRIKVIGRGFPKEAIPETYRNTIEILGFVDDPYQIISNSKAMLTPLFQGAGIKVKVIESLACGTPVIGTAIAFEGLPKGFENFMILCNDEEDFSEAMQKVNMSLEERKLVKKNFIDCYQQDSITKYIDRL